MTCQEMITFTDGTDPLLCGEPLPCSEHSSDETKIVPVQAADHPRSVTHDEQIAALSEGLETCRQIIREKDKEIANLKAHLARVRRGVKALVEATGTTQVDMALMNILLFWKDSTLLKSTQEDLNEVEQQARALADELQKAKGEHAREVAALVSQIEYLERKVEAVATHDYLYYKGQHQRLVDFFRGNVKDAVWAAQLGHYGDGKGWTPAETAIDFLRAYRKDLDQAEVRIKDLEKRLADARCDAAILRVGGVLP